MTTNLLISYPDIAYGSTALATPGVASGYTVADVATGSRGAHYVAPSATSATVWDFDALTTRTPNHFILARADLLRKTAAAAVTWSVLGSASSAFTSPQITTGSFNTTDLKGPRAEDYVTTLSTSAYRYWRVRLATTTNVIHRYSKIYFGEWFDFGADPRYEVPQSRKPQKAGARDSAYTFTLTWKGIPDAVVAAFREDILAYADTHPIFLYDAGDLILNDVRLLHCKIVEGTATPERYNSNTVIVTFQEVI